MIVKHKAFFDRPPSQVPSDKNVDGPLLGNGDVGIVLSGPPEALQFWISKNDFWKSKPGFPNGGPRPVGGLDLRIPALRGASYHVEVDLARAELTGRFAKEGLALELRAWIAATRNVLIIETVFVAGSAEIVPNLWVHEGDGSLTTVLPEFLVSAELRDGVVQSVRILSEKGGACRISNPWPGSEARLVRHGQIAELLGGETLEFATGPMEEIKLTPKPNI